jgi:ABC-type long-subunit fatty acid transport system fused permease/ATPase subunit
VYLDCGEFAVEINIAYAGFAYQFFKFVQQMMVRICPKVSIKDFRCHIGKFINVVYGANLLFEMDNHYICIHNIHDYAPL